MRAGAFVAAVIALGLLVGAIAGINHAMKDAQYACRVAHFNDGQAC